MEAENRAALGDLEDNDLANGTMAFLDRIRPHVGTILLVAAALLAALAAWVVINAQQAAQRAAAWDECLAALAEGDAARLEDVVARYGGSAAAQWSELVLADTALADGNRLMMIDPDRGRRRLQEAVGRYTAVNAARPVDLAAERAILGLARSRESLGELAEARRGYEALVAEHPDSPYAGMAGERIAALSSESTERWYKWFESRPAATAPPAGEAAGSPEEKPGTDEPSAPGKPAGSGEPAEPDQPAESAAGGTPAG